MEALRIIFSKKKNREKIKLNLTSSLGVDPDDPDRQIEEKYILNNIFIKALYHLI